jgi:hypothetical protein
LLQDIGTAPAKAVVDLGFRGVDVELIAVHIIHWGKYKSLTPQQKGWLHRR